MRWRAVAFVLVLALYARASAAPLARVPGRSADLSFLYRVIDVHIAKSSADEVRLFKLSAPRGDGTILAIQVIAGSRPPAGKLARVVAWNLPYSIRTVEAFSLDNTTIKIDGWTYERG